MNKNNDNYSAMNKYYKIDKDEIIEINKNAENISYRDLDGLAELLNEKQYRIEQLKKGNDIKFWKLQYMHLFNTNSLMVNEIERAIRQGYEISDKMKEYVEELKQERMEVMAKAKEEDEW